MLATPSKYPSPPTTTLAPLPPIIQGGPTDTPPPEAMEAVATSLRMRANQYMPSKPTILVTPVASKQPTMATPFRHLLLASYDRRHPPNCPGQAG
eukprot:scaffold4673_cov61-Attheya_sp.AAC.1